MTTMADAFAKHEALYRAQVLADTWGHLDAVPGTEYSGYIVYTYAAGGQAEVIEAEFDGVAGGPAFYEHVNKFAYEQTKGERQRVGVYHWEGAYRVGVRGAAHFKGTRTTLWERSA